MAQKDATPSRPDRAGRGHGGREVGRGEATIEGDPAKFVEFLSLLDTFEFWFNIVTP
ncbi:MAG: hypothetical protein KBG73_14425 [Candidatus Promineofilum sp.]|nr:hypothetical protein [Promineifilum sp.]